LAISRRGGGDFLNECIYLLAEYFAIVCYYPLEYFVYVSSRLKSIELKLNRIFEFNSGTQFQSKLIFVPWLQPSNK